MRLKTVYTQALKNKYNAKITTVDGIKFSSKKEAKYYCDLKLLKKANEIKYFLRQPSFDIGGGHTYKADFMIVDKDDKIKFVDVKGYFTTGTKLKIDLVREKYGIEIEVVF